MKWMYLTILAIFLLNACSKKAADPYLHYQDFPAEKSLQGKVIPLDTALLRYPYRIKIVDSTAFILDLHNADNFLHAFTYPGFKHIVSFGKRGEGPAEMLQANTIRVFSSDSVWTVDGQKTKVSRWSVSSEGVAQKEEEIQLSKSKLWVTDFTLIDDNTFVIPDYSGSCSFYKEDKQGFITDTVGSLPTILHPTSPNRQTLGQVWTRFIDYNPGNGILALVTQLGEVLEIYNLKTGSRQVIYGPHDEPQFKQAKEYAIPDGVMGFGNVFVGNRYIYAIFQGTSFKEIQQAAKAGTPRPQGGQFLYVFNFEGMPVQKYTLDHSISGFHLDEASGKLIALDLNSDDPVVEFNL